MNPLGGTTVASRLSRVGTANVGRTIPLFAVVLELLWAYPWFVWVSRWGSLRWGQPPLSLAGAAVLIGAAEVTSRFFLARNWPLGRVRLVVLALLAVLLALVARLEMGGGYALWTLQWGQYAATHVSPLVGGLVFGVYLLWRGICIGRGSFSSGGLYPRFLFGVVALVVLLVLWRLTSGSEDFAAMVATTGAYVVAYFSVGLLALALANLQSIREEMLRHEGVPGLFYRRWLPLLATVVLAIVLVSMGIASALSFDLLATLLRGLGTLANWLMIAFAYVVGYPLGVLATGLVYVLRFFAHFIGRGQRPQQLGLPDLPEALQGKEGANWRLAPEALLALKWSLLVLAVVLVLLFLARAIARRRRDEVEEGVEEVHESLWTWEGFKADLLSLLRGLLRWFKRRRRAGPVTLSPPVAVAVAEAPYRLFTVREIYQGLLWEGRTAGIPRQQAETPFEYQPRLESHASGAALELEAITRAYVAGRYGEADISGEQLGLLNTLWRRLRTVLHAGSAGERDGSGMAGG